jgi:glutamine amidotransferase
LDRIGIDAELSDDHEVIRSADKVIFPGVGEASTTMSYLKQKNLDKLIIGLKQPVLGICLGMQLLCSYSEENNTDCLGIFKEKVKLFKGENLKVPHMGWNNLMDIKGNLLEGITSNDDVYFVHSYFVEDSPFAIAKTKYGNIFSAALQKDNFYGVQFHPEKSGTVGQKILQNFLQLETCLAGRQAINSKLLI